MNRQAVRMMEDEMKNQEKPNSTAERAAVASVCRRVLCGPGGERLLKVARRRSHILALLVVCGSAEALAAQGVDYARAEQMLTWNLLPLLYGEPGLPRSWFESGSYEIEVASRRWPARASISPMYDPKSERPRA